MVQNLGFIQNLKVRFDTNTRIHLYRYGISNSAKHSQSTSRPSKALILTIKTILPQTQISARTFLSLLAKLSAAADLIHPRQTAFMTSANVPIFGLET